jgi:RsiW-degrading membrane proteinase PrsW (M82 family)
MDIANGHLIAILCGFIPALLWLFFWMAEDSRHPEPKYLLLLSFAVGALVVPLALEAERAGAARLFHGARLEDVLTNTPLLGAWIIVLFAFVEEVFKWIAAYAAALWSKEVDEPVDYIVYLIATALGFAAYENALFLLTPFGDGDVSMGLIMGNLRAVGATLLHVVASSVIGIALAYAFYKRPATRRIYAMIGLVGAVTLHSIFNLAIMASKKENAIMAFVGVWFAIVILLLLFERAKKIHPTT